MTAADHRIDGLASSYWSTGGQDVDQARQVMGEAFAHPPSDPKVLARAAIIAHRADAAAYSERIERDLDAPLRRVREVLGLIDLLGDVNIDAASLIFDHLADWVESEDSLTSVDLDSLGRVRLGAEARPHAARAAVEELGGDRLGAELAGELRVATEALIRDAESYPARALLVNGERDTGLVLGVNVLEGDQPGVDAIDQVELVMNKQAQTVLSPFVADRGGVRWSLEWPLRYDGSSIGVALRVAAMVRFRGLRPDPLLACTGAVSDDGHVRYVEGIPAKLRAAHEAGMRRVLLPRDNEDEAVATDLADELTLLFIEHVDEIQGRVNEATVADELSFEGRVRRAKAALRASGLSLNEEKSLKHCRQLKVSDASSRAVLDIWTSGKVTPGGPAGPTRSLVEKLIAEEFDGDKPRPREGHKFTLMEPWRRDRLVEAFEREGAQAQTVKGNGELFRYTMRRKASQAQVTVWTSGKGHLVGSAPAFDELLALVTSASDGLASVQAKPQDRKRGPAGGHSPDELPSEGPWIGTDESGKGDYFGPLVCAAVYADEQTAELLRELGVQDSKKLSDSRMRQLAPQVRQIVGEGRYKVTPINPARYNALHCEFTAEGKNLNSLLAWGHTRSIEDLLKGGLEPRYAIVDQFADGKYIEQRLMSEARNAKLRVFQLPKAEADLAVAAASILARVEFISWLERTSAKLGITLPKGASPQVIEVAKQVVSNGGTDALTDLAKLHFKTTQAVLG